MVHDWCVELLVFHFEPQFVLYRESESNKKSLSVCLHFKFGFDELKYNYHKVLMMETG